MKVTALIPLALIVTVGCIEDAELGETAIRGQILETVSHAPLEGVIVAIGDHTVGWTETVTDRNGNFVLTNFDLDSTRMHLDGRPASTASAQYPNVTTQVHAEWIKPGHEVTLPEPKYLPRIDLSTAVDMSPYLIDSTDPAHPAALGWKQIDPLGEPISVSNNELAVPSAEDPEGNSVSTSVSATFKPGTFIKFPEGVDPVITVTPVPVNQLPHQLPDYVAPMMMVTFQPAGTLVDPPAEIKFGDFRNISATVPDMPFSVWSLSHSMALFLELGDATIQEGPNGPEIATAEGVGLKELGWHGPVCTQLQFDANIQMREDGVTVDPPSAAITMGVRGGGVSGGFDRSFQNIDGRITSGSLSSCGGYFSFDYNPQALNPAALSNSVRVEVPNWRCANRAGVNDLGMITIEITAGAATTVTSDMRLNPC